MSTPDASLNAAERAALADLESAAAAADPAWASRLRGSRAAPALRSARVQLLRAWLVLLMKSRRLGAPLSLLGLLVIVLGISTGLAVSLVGAAFLAFGLRVATESIPVIRFKRRD